VQNNPHIHTLELSHLQRLSDVSLIAVAHCLPDLHTFVLKHCQAPKTAAIRTTCTKLTTFEVYCQQSPATFGYAPTYSNLALSIITTLKIEATTLNDAQFVAIAQANPNMRTLLISSSYTSNGALITPNAICEALSHLHELESFDVGKYISILYHCVNTLQLDDSVIYALV